ncbi:MAG: hypothetical protein LUD71_00285 [Clostridiales bacterium]|nr:hypothetical protein [Clostridiales bacterium]
MKHKMKYLALVLALVLSVNMGLGAFAADGSSADTGSAADADGGSTGEAYADGDGTGDAGADDESVIAAAADDSEDEDESADSEDTGSGDTVYTAADDEDDGEDEDDADSNGDLYNADFYTATEIGDFSGDLTKTTTASSDLLSWGWLYGEDVTTETELYAEGYAFELEGGVTYEIYVSVDDEDDYNLIGLLLDETFTYIYFNFSGQGDYVTFYVPEDATYYLYLSNAYELNHVNYTGYIGEVASTEIEEEGEVLAVL